MEKMRPHHDGEGKADGRRGKIGTSKSMPENEGRRKSTKRLGKAVILPIYKK